MVVSWMIKCFSISSVWSSQEVHYDDHQDQRFTIDLSSS